MHIFIYHEHGDGDAGLPFCIRSAKRHSPKSPLVLFGNVPCEGIIPVDIGRFSNITARLEPLYVHHGECDRSFQWRSIKRWLIFLEYCRTTGLNSFFTMDSDVLLFCDVDRETAQLSACPLAILAPYGRERCVTLGCSFHLSIEPLRMFSEWLFGFYGVRHPPGYEYVLEQEVNDMLLWDQFLRRPLAPLWNDLCERRSDGSFDANLTLTDGWATAGGSKQIQFEHGIPFGTKNGLREGLKCLHCWGPWKQKVGELWNRSISGQS